MRIFANMFLVLFLADGGLSVFDELLALFYPRTPLSDLRSLVANAVILLAVAIYFCLGIDKRLPKRVFLPLILFIVWCPFATWFFPSLAHLRAFGLVFACIQLLLFMPPLYSIRKAGGKLLLTKEMFPPPFFSLKNTLLFGAANLFIVPVVLVLLGLFLVNAFLSGQTAGFIRLAPDGVHMTERIYRLKDKTIRLVSMIHVGEQEYYDDFVRSVPAGRTVVLAEGITDESNILRNRFGYGKMAGFLGLASQEKMELKGRVIDGEEPEESGAEGAEAGIPDIIRADVDIRTFRPATIRFLNVLGKHLTESTSFASALIAVNGWAKQNVTPEMNETFMDDIIHQRNKEVLSHLGKALPRYDTIIIPWGALHMAEIEKSVVARGFVLQEERDRVSIDFRKLLMRRGLVLSSSLKNDDRPRSNFLWSQSPGFATIPP